MENKSYSLRYLPIFETDLLSTINYITNVLKNESAALRLVDDIETSILKRLENPLAFEPYRSAKKEGLSLLSDLCEELCCILCSYWRCYGSTTPDIWCA